MRKSGSFASALQNRSSPPQTAGPTRARLAAADELDYFEAVAWGYAGRIPFCFRQDFQIVFDGYAAGVESQMVEKGAHTGAGRQLLLFPIYVNMNCFGHAFIILQERGVSHEVKSEGARCSYSLRRE
jgi:hypothetical protein